MTSAINVFIRDAEYIINFFVMMLFYATPILYSQEMFIGTKFEWIIKVNPFATIITCYRDVLFYKSAPHLKSLLVVLLASILVFFIGKVIFNKLQKGFAEEI